MYRHQGMLTHVDLRKSILIDRFCQERLIGPGPSSKDLTSLKQCPEAEVSRVTVESALPSDVTDFLILRYSYASSHPIARPWVLSCANTQQLAELNDNVAGQNVGV